MKMNVTRPYSLDSLDAKNLAILRERNPTFSDEELKNSAMKTLQRTAITASVLFPTPASRKNFRENFSSQEQVKIQRMEARISHLAAIEDPSEKMIRIGTIFFEEWMDSPLERMCFATDCFATKNLKKCGGCNTVTYCSQDCQKRDWRQHKPSCQKKVNIPK